MSASDEMEEVIVEFLVESKEGLDRVDDDLLALEKDPKDLERLRSIFRAIHTVKGTAGFLAYERLQSVAHAAESLLSLLRDGERPFDLAVAEVLFAAVDAIRGMLAQIEAKRDEGNKDYTDLMRRLGELTVEVPASPPAESVVAPAPVPAPAQAATSKAPPLTADRPAPLAGVPAAPPAPAVQVQSPAPPLPSAPGASAGSSATTTPEPDATAANGSASEHDGRAESSGAKAPAAATATETVRVDVSLLDRLMNLVGELVLARNQILQVGSMHQDQAFLATSQRLNLITSELQEHVMRTRMQPIGNVVHKFPRMVRDLAAACRKRVRVEIEGEKTELDRTLLEAIRDPLTHIVRNSVDHGIEAPDVRSAVGKPAEGCLTIRAFHEGGQVTIEVADDGKGIDGVRVRDKALSRSLITPDQADRMSDEELVNLIFLPGFSTAENVSNISGRGVGMDVVRTNVEKVGGTVDVHSVAGKGLTIRIRLPLTLAIIPALIVGNDNERYAIPQISLVEIVRLESGQAKRGIEIVHSTPAYRLRGNLLPLLFLRDALSDQPQSGLASHARIGNDDAVTIVVLSAEDRVFGLVVDRVMDTSEIVVKPLGKHFKSVSLFAGATIMGDGSVALILDAGGLSNHLQSARTTREMGSVLQKAHVDTSESSTALLLCDVGDGRRLAVPLAEVDRLEEFNRDRIEHLGHEQVVQYRGDILRILSIADIAGVGSDSDSDPANQNGPIHVVACRDRGRRIGLKVNRILDVVENVGPPTTETIRPGTLGSVVVGGRLVEVVDVSQWTGSSAGGAGNSHQEAQP